MRFLLITALLALAACSKTPVENQDEAELAETDKQIEEEAKSLEAAADEAVKALEEEIEAELLEDGISSTPTPPPVTENQEGE